MLKPVFIDGYFFRVILAVIFSIFPNLTWNANLIIFLVTFFHFIIYILVLVY